MYFNVREWSDSQDDNNAAPRPCPYRVLDPSDGCVINGVTEFDDDEGWVRVLVRNPDKSGYHGEWGCHPTQDVLVSQIVQMPFQVVPYYDGIDDLPRTSVDTVEFIDQEPIGDWLPATAPYRKTP